MRTKNRVAMTRRMREWWTTVRYPANRRGRVELSHSELMFERLRAEFALEPIPPARRSP